MLEKIINKKTVNTLSCVPKSNIADTKNLQVITRQGTKTGLDRNELEILKIIQKDDYSNTDKQKGYIRMQKKYSRNYQTMKRIIRVTL